VVSAHSLGFKQPPANPAKMGRGGGGLASQKRGVWAFLQVGFQIPLQQKETPLKGWAPRKWREGDLAVDGRVIRKMTHEPSKDESRLDKGGGTKRIDRPELRVAKEAGAQKQPGNDPEKKKDWAYCNARPREPGKKRSQKNETGNRTEKNWVEEKKCDRELLLMRSASKIVSEKAPQPGVLKKHDLKVGRKNERRT